jgi:hypothetical protein
MFINKDEFDTVIWALSDCLHGMAGTGWWVINSVLELGNAQNFIPGS